MPSQDLGTALSHGLSIYTAGGSAVSAYGPIIGANVAVIALTVPATLNSMSVNTTFAVPGAAVGDGVILHPPSALSAGVTAFGFVPSAGNVTITLTASGATAVQTAQTWGVSLMRRSFVTSIR
jgi:hypothetical protein